MQIIQNETPLNKNQIRRVQTFELLLSVASSVICFICFYAVFDIPGNRLLIYALSFLAAFGLYFLKNSKFGRYVNVYLPLIIAGFIAIAYKTVWRGLLIICNAVIAKINDYTGFGLLSYYTGSVSNESLYVTLTLIPIILIISYVFVSSVKRRLFLPVFLVSLPFVFTVLYFRANALLPAVILMIIVWALLLSNSVGEKALSIKRTAWVFLIIAAFTTAIYFVLPLSEYVPSQTTEKVKESISNSINDIRFGADDEINALPNGDLQNLKSQEFTDTIVMTVTMQKPSAVYLKSYVGSIYRDNRWIKLDASYYGSSYMGLFEWLAKNNFYPQSQISSLQGLNANAKTYKVTINNTLLTSKYIYIPYEAAVSEDITSQDVKFIKDYAVYSKGFIGEREYSFNTYPPLDSDYGTADLNDWANNNIKDEIESTRYLKYEKAYRAFVYDSYLNVPAKTQEALNDFFTKDTMDALKNKSYQSIIEFLRKYYLEKLNYSSEIGSLPEGSDFIENFLKTGNGYDAHFATLSVMVLRESGIPARYVEGYYLPHEYADEYADTPNSKLEITDSFAHAWAEIYVDGIGWIPAELTPGYYNVGKDTSDTSGKDEDISQNDSNFYIDEEKIQSNDEKNNDNDQQNFNIKPLHIIIIAIILVVLAYIILILIVRRKRIQSFAQPDKTKAALQIYKHSSRLIKFDGIKINQHSALESIPEISKKYDDSMEMNYNEFLTYVYKARYSNQGINDTELAFMKSYINSLANQIYDKQGLNKKIRLKLLGLI